MNRGAANHLPLLDEIMQSMRIYSMDELPSSMKKIRKERKVSFI